MKKSYIITLLGIIFISCDRPLGNYDGTYRGNLRYWNDSGTIDTIFSDTLSWHLIEVEKDVNNNYFYLDGWNVGGGGNKIHYFSKRGIVSWDTTFNGDFGLVETSLDVRVSVSPQINEIHYQRSSFIIYHDSISAPVSSDTYWLEGTYVK